MTATTRFEHHVDIDARIVEVWALTEAIETWPSFTPTMTRIRRLDDGPLRVGSTAQVKQPGQRPARWTVTTLEPPIRFEWQTKLLGATITAGHHLLATDRGCRQTLNVDLSGAGSRILARLVGSRIARSIATENEAFKQRAEQRRDPDG